MEGGSGLSQVDSVEANPSLGMLLLVRSLSHSHIHGSEHWGWDVLFQSSARCGGCAQRNLAPGAEKSEWFS